MNNREHIAELVEKHLDGALTDQEQDELKLMLDGDKESCRVFVEEMKIHAALEESFSLKHESVVRYPDVAEQSMPSSDPFRQPRRQTASFHLVARIAATLAIIAGGYWLLSRYVSERTSGKTASVVLASVQAVNGRVEIVRLGQSLLARTGMEILDQDGIVVSTAGSADVRYTGEPTTVVLQSETTAKLWLHNSAKRIRLDTGTVVCSVAKQPKGSPMRLVTANAEAEVLGTELMLSVVG
jgi:ferric-dicitrate binding protein FerR (iron transport regulator)